MEERIIDTCCLLNLYASGEHMAILKHIGSVFVSEHVQNESLWIREPDLESPQQLAPKQVDLNNAIDAGIITVCPLEEQQEIDWYVYFAQSLDDGESSVLAIAKVRGWTVATDDKKARRIAAEHQVSTISTSEIIHRWVTFHGMKDEQIGEVLRRVQQFGRFRPGRSDVFHDWWIQMAGTSKS